MMWLWMLIAVAVGIVIGALGASIGYESREEPDGVLIVNRNEDEPGEGLYLQLWREPKTLKSREMVGLRVMTVDRKDDQKSDQSGNWKATDVK